MKKSVSICFFLIAAAIAAHAQQHAFWNEVEAFKKADSVKAYPENAILFAGSSSFRMWKNLEQDFYGYTVINRGFGGSKLEDLLFYSNEILFPHKPRQIVIYCGENDLASSDTVTSQVVIGRFRKLFYLIREKMPDVQITYVSIKPSPSRKKLLPKIKEANKGIRKFIRKTGRSNYVDVFHKMMNGKNEIREDIFINDSLHLNDKGYAIWQRAIKPYLTKD